jgi:hypothetical protein
VIVLPSADVRYFALQKSFLIEIEESRLYCQALDVRYFALQKSFFYFICRAYIAKRWM